MISILTKQHREILDEVSNKLTGCVTDLQELAAEYQGKFDEMSEQRQESEKGQELESLVSSLQAAADSVQQAVDTVDGIGGCALI
jgi:hypothetical protein